ncbi:MAG: DUF4404 family protein [Planctomycetota bacterium]
MTTELELTLDETLDELHEQLANVNHLDGSERERLRQAVSEIQASLDRFDISSTSLAKRLRDATIEFEDSHPVVTQTAGRLVDMLSQMGI